MLGFDVMSQDARRSAMLAGPVVTSALDMADRLGVATDDALLPAGALLLVYGVVDRACPAASCPERVAGGGMAAAYH